MYKRFEDLPVYQTAAELTECIYSLIAGSAIQQDFSFKDQLRKATLSITNNIAEGFERDSNNEFRYFLRVAKGSAGEVRSMLLIAHRLEYISDQQLSQFNSNLEDIGRQIGGFLRYLQRHGPPTRGN